MTEPTMRLSIVLPCYNEALSLPLLLQRYRESWEELPAELVLVDNGSTDNTAEVLQSLSARSEYRFMRSIRVPKNRGYGYGIMAGLRAAAGEVLAFSHADLQCAPADVFRAFHKLNSLPESGRAVVKGRRGRRNWSDSFVTAGMSVLASAVLGSRLTDINAQPKVFHRSHLERLQHAPDGFQLDLFVLYQAKANGMSIVTIPVEFAQRRHGQSNWAYSLRSRYQTIRQMIDYMFKLRLGYRQ